MDSRRHCADWLGLGIFTDGAGSLCGGGVMGIQLELGKTYLTRDARVVKIIDKTNSNLYKWRGSNLQTYRDKGRVYEKESNINDLVHEVESAKDKVAEAAPSGLDNGGPAFPQRDELGEMVVVHGGVTIRDYFAAKAMVALIPIIHANHSSAGSNEGMKAVSDAAYGYADAMLRARGES